METTQVTDQQRQQSEALLRWYLDAGVDEVVGEQPINRFRDASGPGDCSPAAMAERASPPVDIKNADDAVEEVRPVSLPGDAEVSPGRPARRGRPPLDPGEAVRDAVSVAGAAKTLQQLEEALAAFNGCGLSRTAMNLVFGDGAADARVVFIGEAPGAEEDRLGKPFVGPSGRLLDKMIATIGLDRRNVFISNTIYWRPPGNRSPTSEEVAVCMPFLERMIELIEPACLVALGGPAAGALLDRKESVGRLRGRWFGFQTPRMAAPVATTALFHPAYLLRSPGQKRLAWRDLLGIKRKLAEMGVAP